MTRAAKLRSAILALGALLLGACVSGVPHLERLSDLQSDEVILVGRIELVPPLREAEQELKTATSDRFRGKAHAILDGQLHDLDNLPMSIGNSAVFLELGKDFHVRYPRMSELYYSGSLILLRSSASYSGYMNRNVAIDHAQIKLPGRLKFALQPGDRAVYFGTLRYHRDAYNAITKVEFIDEYERANREFARKFGNGARLRRLSAQRVK